MKMRYWLVLLGIAWLGIPATAVSVTIDGKLLSMSPKPVIRGRRVYVPVDAFRKIGLWVKWTHGSRRARVGWPDSDFIIDFSVSRVWVEPLGPEDAKETLPGRPFVRKGKLMIPVRVMVDGNQLTAEWNSRTGVVALHRERHWYGWRTQNDKRLREEWPDNYETPV